MTGCRMAIMNLEIVAVQFQERRPVLALGDRRRFVKRRLRLLVRHFQEKEKRQLLHVVPVRETVIPEDVAVVPELLDEGGGIAHDAGRKVSVPGFKYSARMRISRVLFLKS